MFSFCSQTHYLTLCGRSNEWEERPRMLLQLKFLYMGKCRKENKYLPHPFTFQVLSRTNSQSPFLPILPYALLHRRRHRGSLLAVNATFTLSELFFIAFILSCKCNNWSISLWPLLFPRISLKLLFIIYLLLFMLSYSSIINTVTDKW